jgi:hypothetical protein
MENLKWLGVYLLVITIIIALGWFQQGLKDIEYWSEDARSVITAIMGVFSFIYLIIFGVSK